MNNLQRLFKARGISVVKLAAKLGLNYHSVQKTVKGVWSFYRIQAAVAGYLGLTVEQCFGPRSARYLQPLIECEINRKRTEYEGKLKAKFLDTPTVSRHRKAVNG
jgi:hypothetical protein